MPSQKVDPALLEALHLDPATTEMNSHGGSSFASTYKLSSTDPASGARIHYFVKTGSGPAAETMFRGEHASLNAVHTAVPNLCPRSHAHGALAATPGGFFLATDFLDLGSSAPGGSGQSLAEKLARLHSAPAPPPPGRDKPVFGFPVATCCGASEQDNTFNPSWADFYAESRLRHIVRLAARNQGPDAELEAAVEVVASRVVPRLIGEDTLRDPVPVVVHGDLWSGNHSRGQIAGRGGCEEVVYDPSCVYAHSEYELGIMKMFGGFSGHFWKEYESLVPKAEPAAEWEDRVKLYELSVNDCPPLNNNKNTNLCRSYHHLNHYAMFGGGYRIGAMSIIKKLIAKYGS